MTLNSSEELAKYCQSILSVSRQRLQRSTLPVQGKITNNTGFLVQAKGCVTRRGEICKVRTASGNDVDARVVGFNDEVTHLILMDHVELLPGASVTPTGRGQLAPVGHGLTGRVVDSCGVPLDGAGPLHSVSEQSIEPLPLSPMDRVSIDQPLDVGVRSINGLLSIGRGQRLGLFAASGLGKSVLLGMMARHTEADITVVCLLGERGREVQEFIQHILGPQGLKKSIVVAIPADHTPLRRISGAKYATAIASYFRAQGLHVLLLLDSLTRYAHAGREIALAAGEPPVSGGYPSSVFTELPILLEAGGSIEGGSVTAIYTLLMESSDNSDPLAEAAKSILDGHVMLSRDLAESGHYPAIDVLASTSRLRDAITQEEQQLMVRQFLHLYAVYQRNRDLLSLGMYQRGDNPDLDLAIDLIPAMTDFLTQTAQQQINFPDSVAALRTVFGVNENHSAVA